ncbi:MAG: hypothetical protein GVY12_14095 [Bacteroidetes bacterium]|jgi:hypothetical protein|nr:hypothetical protein [Bacteroidota bacterium]
MMDATQHYRRWRWLAPAGLLTIGAGLSVVGQATLFKTQQAPTRRWVLWGTAGLALTNAGLSMLGDSIKHRTLYEWQQDTDRVKNT